MFTVNDPTHEYQIELSPELLALLAWLTAHETETFRALIKQTIKNGFAKHLITMKPESNEHQMHELQEGVTDFFCMLDELLLEILHQDSDTIQNEQFSKRFHQIEYEAINLIQNLPKTESDWEKTSDKNKEKIMLQEILRRWKPQKKTMLN